MAHTPAKPRARLLTPGCTAIHRPYVPGLCGRGLCGRQGQRAPVRSACPARGQARVALPRCKAPIAKTPRCRAWNPLPAPHPHPHPVGTSKKATGAKLPAGAHRPQAKHSPHRRSPHPPLADPLKLYREAPGCLGPKKERKPAHNHTFCRPPIKHRAQAAVHWGAVATPLYTHCAARSLSLSLRLLQLAQPYYTCVGLLLLYKAP